MNKKLKEGRIFVYNLDYNNMIIVGLKCETDFLAKSEKFQNALLLIGEKVSLKKTEEIQPIIDNLSKEAKEQIILYDIRLIPTSSDTITRYYLHHDHKKVGCIRLVSDIFNEEIEALGYNLSMHIVAFRPQYLTEEEIDWANIDLDIPEKILNTKPLEIIEKIKNGKKSKYIAENVLLEQPFVKDMTITVKQMIKQLEQKYNTSIKLIDYDYMFIEQEELSENIKKVL